MRSFEAFKILANDTRNLGENCTFSPPSINRLFELTDERGYGLGKNVGYSVETNGKEDFYETIGSGVHRGAEKLGHTVKDSNDLRTFVNAEGVIIGHEQPDHSFKPAQDNVISFTARHATAQQQAGKKSMGV